VEGSRRPGASSHSRGFADGDRATDSSCRFGEDCAALPQFVARPSGARSSRLKAQVATKSADAWSSMGARGAGCRPLALKERCPAETQPRRWRRVASATGGFDAIERIAPVAGCLQAASRRIHGGFTRRRWGRLKATCHQARSGNSGRSGSDSSGGRQRGRCRRSLGRRWSAPGRNGRQQAALGTRQVAVSIGSSRERRDPLAAVETALVW